MGSIVAAKTETNLDPLALLVQPECYSSDNDPNGDQSVTCSSVGGESLFDNLAKQALPPSLKIGHTGSTNINFIILGAGGTTGTVAFYGLR